MENRKLNDNELEQVSGGAYEDIFTPPEGLGPFDIHIYGKDAGLDFYNAISEDIKNGNAQSAQNTFKQCSYLFNETWKEAIRYKFQLKFGYPID